MSSILKQPLFFIPSTLYLISLADKYFQLNFPVFLKNYLADFLCLPVVLTLTIWTIQKIKKDKSLRLNTLKIFVAFLYVSIFFEWILPQFSKQYVADCFDVLAYGFGAIYFYIIQKKSFNFKQHQTS